MRLQPATDDFEENDIPFMKNDLRDRPGAMGKPLNTVDAPGKADSEIGEEALYRSPDEASFIRKDEKALYQGTA
jgi:hypothetical protein